MKRRGLVAEGTAELQGQGLLRYVVVGCLVGVVVMLGLAAWLGLSALAQVGIAAVVVFIAYRGACAMAIADRAGQHPQER